MLTRFLQNKSNPIAPTFLEKKALHNDIASIIEKHANDTRDASDYGKLLPSTLTLKSNTEEEVKEYRRLSDDELHERGLLQISKEAVINGAYICYMDTFSNEVVFITRRNQMSVTPLHCKTYLSLQCTCREIGVANDQTRLIIMVYQINCNHTILQETPSNEIPITVADAINQIHTYARFMTPTVMFSLLGQLVAVANSLPSTSYCVFSIDSIYILNPSVLQMPNEQRPMSFKICPHSVGIKSELPEHINPLSITTRTLADTILLIICRLNSLNSPLLSPRLVDATFRSPGLVSMYMEIAEKSNLLWDGNELGNGSIIDTCSSAKCYSVLRRSEDYVKSFDFTIDHVPCLLSGMACHASPYVHRLSAVCLWKLIEKESKSHEELRDKLKNLKQESYTDDMKNQLKQQRSDVHKRIESIIIILETFAAILVPGLPGESTGLHPGNSSNNEAWSSRMSIIDWLLCNVGGTGDVARLNKLQQKLIDNGMAKQFNNDSITITLSNYSLWTRVKISMSIFSRSNVSVARLGPACVRRMARVLMDAYDKDIIKAPCFERNMCSLMIISEFGRWIDAQQEFDQKLLSILKDICNDDDIFLSRALPCYYLAMDHATVVFMVDKLKAITKRLLVHIAAHSDDHLFPPFDNSRHGKLVYCLQWCCQFAWNSALQSETHSVFSPSNSRLLDVVLCRQNSNFIAEHANFNKSTILMNGGNEVCHAHHYSQVTTRKALFELYKHISPMCAKSRYVLKMPQLAILPTQLGQISRLWVDNGGFKQRPKISPQKCPAHSKSVILSAPSYRHDIFHTPQPVSLSVEETLLSQTYGFALDDQLNCSEVSSMSLSAIKDNGLPAFEQVTLIGFNRPICETDGDCNENGNVERVIIGCISFVTRQTGDLNKFMLGLTWDLKSDNETLHHENDTHSGIEYLIPGESRTSVGFDTSTGCVQFWRDDDNMMDYNYSLYDDIENLNNETLATRDEIRQCHFAKNIISIPYAPPVTCGSRVSICITNDCKVFLIINGMFYPPIPGLSIPSNSKILALARFYAPSSTLSYICMTDLWRLNERDQQGIVVDRDTNPLAYLIFTHCNRAGACYHVVASMLPNDLRIGYFDLIDDSMDESIDDDVIKRLLAIIFMSSGPCGPSCKVREFFSQLSKTIIKEAKDFLSQLSETIIKETNAAAREANLATKPTETNGV